MMIGDINHWGNRDEWHYLLSIYYINSNHQELVTKVVFLLLEVSRALFIMLFAV